MPKIYQGKSATIAVQPPSGTTTPNAPVFTDVVAYIESYNLRLTKPQETLNVLHEESAIVLSTGSEWTVDFTLPFDPESADNQDEIMEMFLAGSFSGNHASADGELQLNFYLDATTAGSRKVFYGKCVGSSFDFSATGGGVTRMNVTLSGSGDLLYTASGA